MALISPQVIRDRAAVKVAEDLLDQANRRLIELKAIEANIDADRIAIEAAAATVAASATDIAVVKKIAPAISSVAGIADAIETVDDIEGMREEVSLDRQAVETSKQDVSTDRQAVADDKAEILALLSEGSVEIKSRADALGYHPSQAPAFIRTAGYAVPGDGGGALYERLAVEPQHGIKFPLTLSGGGIFWYGVAEEFIRPEMLGAPNDGLSPATAQMQALFASGRNVRLRKGAAYLVAATLMLSTAGQVVDLNGASIKAAVGFDGQKLIDIQASDVSIGGKGTIDGSGLPVLSQDFIGGTWEGFGIACRGTSGNRYSGLRIGDGVIVRNCPGSGIGIEYVDDLDMEGVKTFNCSTGVTFDAPGSVYLNQISGFSIRHLSLKGTNWKGLSVSNGQNGNISQVRVSDGKSNQAGVFFKGCSNFTASGIQVSGGFGIKCDKSNYFQLSGIAVDCGGVGEIGLMVQGGSNFVADGIQVKDYTDAGIIHVGHPSAPEAGVKKAVYSNFNIVHTGTPGALSAGIKVYAYSTANAEDAIFSAGYIQNCYVGLSVNQASLIAHDNVVFQGIVIDGFASIGASGAAKNTTWRGLKFRNGGASASCIRPFGGNSADAVKYVVDGCEADAMASTVTFLNLATAGSTGVRVAAMDVTNNRMSGGSRLINMALNNAADYIRVMKISGNVSYDSASSSAIQLSNVASLVNTQICAIGNLLISAAGAKRAINFIENAASGKWNGVVENNMSSITNKPNNV